MDNQPFISIVSPVYKAEYIVHELVKQIVLGVTEVTSNYEIILVEDGSPDQSWVKISEECENNKNVKGVKLSRNFGQQYAISAAIEQAKGDYVIVMDCDLQDNPKYIKDLYAKAIEGYDIVYTKYEERKHNFIKDFFAQIFHYIYNVLVDERSVQSDGKIGNYSLLSRKAVVAFMNFKDYHRNYLPILKWIGFDHTIVKIQHEERFSGDSSYSFLKLLSLAIDGIVSQSEKLLLLSIYTGFGFSFLGVLYALYVVVKSFTVGFQVGWASLVVLMLISTGLILISLGVVGVYIGKIFVQSKERPLYLVDKKINCS